MCDRDELFAALVRSKFRSRFRLGPKETSYLNEKTLAVILEHGRRFVTERLADAQPQNNGKQTPMRGHPVLLRVFHDDGSRSNGIGRHVLPRLEDEVNGMKRGGLFLRFRRRFTLGHLSRNFVEEAEYLW